MLFASLHQNLVQQIGGLRRPDGVAVPHLRQRDQVHRLAPLRPLRLPSRRHSNQRVHRRHAVTINGYADRGNNILGTYMDIEKVNTLMWTTEVYLSDHRDTT